ncbi:hypothetical protein CDL15_Pgr027678 [Punica granatum]|uniref:Uncharacterized protein n=1 Tax=Punica granatum TaxID=22663 RepID=A0A218XK93_PUNGR|nr:hypothetical protein CDL15_Pgr027678 [Punica granatum]
MLLILRVDQMGKQDKAAVDTKVEVMDKEQVPTMDRVTWDKEKVRDFHKEIRETCREIKGAMALEDLTRSNERGPVDRATEIG